MSASGENSAVLVTQNIEDEEEQSQWSKCAILSVIEGIGL